MGNTTLIIMAAGLGSRYGGLKQVDPVGPNGEIIIDYSIYDALRSGFDKIIFVIKEENKEIFKSSIGDKIQRYIDLEYVYQSLEDLPQGCELPEGRIKPWGTAHAVYACRDVVKTPFAVINADDYYGYSAFKAIYDYLRGVDEASADYAMVGFKLSNTLTENGYVSRGVCSLDNNGYLKNIKERTKISRFSDGIKYSEDDKNWQLLTDNSTVSMNIWGFTPRIFSYLEKELQLFFKELSTNPLKSECFLPNVVNNIITDNNCRVKVLESKEKWYGVTYKEDKPIVQRAIREFIDKGLYPEKLWEADYNE